MPNLDRLRSTLDSYRMECRIVSVQVKAEEATVAQVREKAEATLRAQQLVQVVAEQVQQQAHRQVASVVTRCLKAVFGEDSYEFQIIFERKRGRTEARLLFTRDGLEVEPLEAAGGGVVDVAAFALRLACLMLSMPRKRKLLVLDEPFRFVSQEYRPRVRELLLTLSKEMEVQILLVTHAEELVCGKVIEL